MDHTNFKFLYKPETPEEAKSLSEESFLSVKENISLLEDFNNFLKIYHRMSSEEIECFFEKEVMRNIRFIGLKVILDAFSDQKTDDEIVEVFGKEIYKYIYDVCINLEYDRGRSGKYAELYEACHKKNIRSIL